jgi:hypothetical protein
MKKLGLIFFFILTGLITRAQFKVVGYLPNFSISAINEYADKTDFGKLTHLNIAFFNPDTNGDFPLDKGVGLKDIVAKAHYKNVKVLLSLAGGSDQSQYTNLLRSENRAAFIGKIMNLVSLYQVDGIDVDLEGDNIDANYEAFVTELAAQLKSQNKLISGAVSWWTRARITDACLAAYDFINIMAYGGSAATHASPAYAQQHINYWKSDRGLSASKLVLGIAFYGRYDLDNGGSVAIAYKDLIHLYPDAPTKDVIVRSEDGKEIRYCGVNGTKNRTVMAQQQCGGIMIWQILQDADGDDALLKVIDEQVNGTSIPETPVASSYGKWAGAVASTFWSYNPGEALAVRNATTSAQSFVAPDFLAAPATGNVRAFLFGNATPGGSFSISNQNIAAVANHTGGAHKFAAYGISGASSVTSLFLTLNVNQTPTNGLIILGLGNASGAIYTNTSQLNSSTQIGLFTALQFAVGASAITVKYRGNTAPYTYATLSPTLAKSTDLALEIYCNNSSVDQYFQRAGVTYAIPSKCYRVYVNGVPLRISGNCDLPYSAEITTNQPINSFIINGSDSTLPTNNALLYTVSNIKLGSNDTVLPVSLIDFTANKHGSEVRLNWSTAMEQNHQYFELYKSSNNTDNFLSIHKVRSTINSSGNKKYSYTDFYPKNGVNYYKLVQVDADGLSTGTWFAIANVSFEENKRLSAFVDAHQQLQVIYTSKDDMIAHFQLKDVLGKPILNTKLNITKGHNSFTMDINKINPGLYLLTLLEPTNKTSIKLFINK